jgi:hypothetical protein
VTTDAWRLLTTRDKDLPWWDKRKREELHRLLSDKTPRVQLSAEDMIRSLEDLYHAPTP